MQDLIERLTASTGIDATTAEKAVGIILGFLRTEGPTEKVQAIIDATPGAEAAIKLGESVSGGLGAMLGSGIMAVGSKLMSAGLSMGQIPQVSREIVAYSREKVGSDTIDEILAAVPGLSQFV